MGQATLDKFAPEMRDLESDPDLSRSYRHWQASRRQFLHELKVPSSEAVNEQWQKHHVRGTAPDGTKAPVHQMKMSLRSFREGD